MKVPGGAWLEMRATPTDDGGSIYDQRAVFFPRGLGGRLYWFAILPFHGVIFNGMANRITETALLAARRDAEKASPRESASALVDAPG